jgi:carboxymethylenebutenolidase
MNRMITFERPDKKECAGFYVEPETGKSAPGIVVIQEWWGLNDQIKGVANRLAADGYRVLVPDLYRGQLGLDAKEAEHLMNNLNFADAATQDIRGAVLHLKSTSPAVGVTGFCMGGALTLLTASNVSEIDAAVSWYGFPPLEYIDATKIKVPLMGHFAIDDAYFPIQQVDILQANLEQAGVPHEFHRYNAQHAFANETAVDLPIPVRYNAAAAETAWQRTMAFLDQHLRSESTGRKSAATTVSE